MEKIFSFRSFCRSCCILLIFSCLVSCGVTKYVPVTNTEYIDRIIETHDTIRVDNVLQDSVVIKEFIIGDTVYKFKDIVKYKVKTQDRIVEKLVVDSVYIEKDNPEMVKAVTELESKNNKVSSQLRTWKFIGLSGIGVLILVSFLVIRKKIEF